jgi:hypothetical protein
LEARDWARQERDQIMHLYLAGLALLLLAFVVHVVTWRVHLPKRSMRALLCVFAKTPLVAVPIFMVIEPSAVIDASLSDTLHVLLFYVPSSLVYVCLYSAIEAQSPSLAKGLLPNQLRFPVRRRF